MTATESPKRRLHRLLRAPVALLVRAQVDALAAGLGGPTTALVVFDLDNTLADTASSYRRPFRSHAQRLRGVAPMPAMLALLRRVAARHPVLVLTARSYRHAPLTARWLARHAGLGPQRVVVCTSPTEKVALIARLQPKFARVVLIDDLTHGHERGEVRTYDDAIAALAALGVAHFGDAFIQGVTDATLADAAERIDQACQGDDPLRPRRP